MTNIQEAQYDSNPHPTELHGQNTAHLKFLRRCIAGRTSILGRPVNSLLDVGCATGSVLLALPPDIKKVGVDISPVQVNTARRHGLEAHVCDLETEQLPFESGAFDVVCAFNIIEHIFHTDHVLNELNRVLSHQGVLVASVPNICQPATLIMMLLDRTPMYAARYRCLHVRDFTISMFKRILRKHGFEPKRSSGSFLFPFENAAWSHAISNLVPRLGAIIVVGATKNHNAVVAEGIARNFNELQRFLRNSDLTSEPHAGPTGASSPPVGVKHQENP